MQEVTIRLHEIATDGLPDMRNGNLSGRVALLFENCIVSGWPVEEAGHPGEWEADLDVGHSRRFVGITHWVEFSSPLRDLQNGKKKP